MADLHQALAGCRTIPAQGDGGRREGSAPVVGQPRDAQPISESGGLLMKHPVRGDFDTAVTEAC
jgi:hypothetical protein